MTVRENVKAIMAYQISTACPSSTSAFLAGNAGTLARRRRHPRPKQCEAWKDSVAAREDIKTV